MAKTIKNHNGTACDITILDFKFYTKLQSEKEDGIGIKIDVLINGKELKIRHKSIKLKSKQSEDMNVCTDILNLIEKYGKILSSLVQENTF